jgi:hypothetical protein
MNLVDRQIHTISKHYNATRIIRLHVYLLNFKRACKRMMNLSLYIADLITHSILYYHKKRNLAIENSACSHKPS